MKVIKIFKYAGSFAENKDKAREIREKEILSDLNNGNEIVLDFAGVNSATQSFIHALISEVIREKGVEILDKLIFKNCNNTIKNIVNIVTEYMQQDN